MRIRKVFNIVFFIATLIICGIALSPIYLQQSLIHWYANIDDYKIFINNTVNISQHDEWLKSENYNQYHLSDEEKEYIEKYKTVAYLVIKDEKILFEKYWDKYESDSYSNMFSVTKSIVSLLIGIAIEEGYIYSINERIGNYIPEFSKDDRGEITIKNLLTMSSGLDWQETYSSPFSITTKAYYGTKLREISVSQNLQLTPGQFFIYQSGNTQLLGYIIEKATGRSLNEYAAEKIWKPIGAKNPALWSIDKKGGDERAFCCFFTNARDIARIGQLILNKGRWNGNQIISNHYLEMALRPANHLIDVATNQPCDFYGFQWWILNYENQQIPYMRGHLGQYVYVLPDDNAVIVRLGKKRHNLIKNRHPIDIENYFVLGKKILNN